MTNRFYDDRCYAAAPDEIDAPRLSPGDLLPGDVLLFRGTHPVSNGIRFWDDCNFDHCAMIVETPTDQAILSRFPESTRSSPWIRDISYEGTRLYPLATYEDLPTYVLVRRHRLSGWREHVLRQEQHLADTTSGYGFNHLITLVIASLTRTAARLRENSERWDGSEVSSLPLERRVGADARMFAANVHALFDFIMSNQEKASKQAKAPGVERICAEYVHDSFDVASDDHLGEGSLYYGLVLEPRPNDGLLAWAASGRTFLEFLSEGSLPSVPDSEPFKPTEELNRLERDLGISVSVLPYRDPQAVTDEDLRRAVVNSAYTVLKTLGWRPDKSAPTFPPAPEAIPAMALFLLDQLLKRRHLISQFDIASTKSLFDAGLLRTDEVDWQPIESADGQA